MTRMRRFLFRPLTLIAATVAAVGLLLFHCSNKEKIGDRSPMLADFYNERMKVGKVQLDLTGIAEKHIQIGQSFENVINRLVKDKFQLYAIPPRESRDRDQSGGPEADTAVFATAEDPPPWCFPIYVEEYFVTVYFAQGRVIEVRARFKATFI